MNNVDVDAVVNIQQVLVRYCRRMDRTDAPLTLDCSEADADLTYSGLSHGVRQESVDWLWPAHARITCWARGARAAGTTDSSSPEDAAMPEIMSRR